MSAATSAQKFGHGTTAVDDSTNDAHSEWLQATKDYQRVSRPRFAYDESELAPGVLPFAQLVEEILFDYHEEADGCVRYILVDSALTDLEVAEAAMKQLQLHVRPYNWFAYDLSRAVATSLTLEQFVGRGYDYESESFTYVWNSQPQLGSSGYVQTDAYAEAFCGTPHGIELGNPKVPEWFRKLNDELLGGLTPDLPILQWTTDWAGWFGPGHEWWGSFMWSIRPPARDWTVVITASATD